MKKIFTFVAALFMASAAMADDVTVGIQRPTFAAEDGSVTYDTKNYWETTAAFNKSVDGLTASFYQSPEIEATLVADETQEGGYEIKSLCHQGVKNFSVDYVWKVACTAGKSQNHNAENPLGSEKYAFGFDLTVAEGKTFKVNAIDFDLLVEQNPAYCIIITDAAGKEVYNSTWVTKTGGYNSEEWGAGSYCRITSEGVSFLFEKLKDGNPINYQAIQYYPGFEEGFGVETPLPADFTLAAGAYKVVALVDFNKDSVKGMSFDNFTLEGTLEGGSTPVEPGNAGAVGIARPTFAAEDGSVTYDTKNYWETTDAFNMSIDGVTASFYQSPEIEATLVADETQEGGYEIKSLCHQGVKNFSVDYVWKVACTAGKSQNHNAENPLGSEKYAFGFDVTVADGKQFKIDAIDFDLLVEQNPAYCITITDAAGKELYNSTWVTKTGGYNSEEWGAGSYCRITSEGVSFLFEKLKDGNPINYQAIQYYPGFEEGFGVETPLPADFTLAAGTYQVRAAVDFNKDSVKGMSFDNFTLEGTVSDASGIKDIMNPNTVLNGSMFNLAGQRIAAPVKGQVYILNGKKYLAK